MQSASCPGQWMAQRAHWGYQEGDQWSIGSLIWIVWQNRRSKQSSKSPSRIEKFVTESVRKGCHKRLSRLIAPRRAKVQVPAAHFNLNLRSFVPDSSSSMIWLWGWAATTGHCALICLTKVILCFKGQVTDTNRRLQDAGREVRYAARFCEHFCCQKRSDSRAEWNRLINYEGSVLFDLPLCKVTAQTEEVIRCRVQQRNMATTVEKLQLCIPGKICKVNHTYTHIIIHYIRY